MGNRSSPVSARDARPAAGGRTGRGRPPSAARPLHSPVFTALGAICLFDLCQSSPAGSRRGGPTSEGAPTCGPRRTRGPSGDPRRPPRGPQGPGSGLPLRSASSRAVFVSAPSDVSAVSLANGANILKLSRSIYFWWFVFTARVNCPARQSGGGGERGGRLPWRPTAGAEVRVSLAPPLSSGAEL